MTYLDANIFLYAILYDDNKAKTCKKLLTSVVDGEKDGVTSFLTWDEVTFIVLKTLGRKTSIREGKKLLELSNLRFIRADERVMVKAQKLTERYKLKPRDAIHAASAIVSGCTEIISDDSDFDSVEELKRISVGS